MSHVEAMSEIAAIIYRYSTAMDTRQWHLMDDVFTPDAIGDLGGLVCNGRGETVRFIRAAIECCERTHHMNSNIEAVVTGSSARVSSRFSAWHTGKDKTRDEVFLALGTYTDEFVSHGAGLAYRTPRGAHADRSLAGRLEETRPHGILRGSLRLMTRMRTSA